MMRASEQLLKAVAVTAELCQTQLSEAAARVMCEDLASYPEHQVLAALKRCRRELKGRQSLVLGEILARLEDGRPGPEEAWAVVTQTQNEAATIVWTDEMQRAWGVALPLIKDGDMVPARMAFREAYAKEVQEARDNHSPVRWTASLGTDPHGRNVVLLEAVEKGRIAATHAQGLLAHTAAQLPEQIQALVNKSIEGKLLPRT